MRRHALGILALILLVFAVFTVSLAPPGNSRNAVVGGCVRAGVVLGALWLALPQILATIASMPGWLLGWFIKKQVPPSNSSQEQQPPQPVVKPPRPRRRST